MPDGRLFLSWDGCYDERIFFFLAKRIREVFPRLASVVP